MILIDLKLASFCANTNRYHISYRKMFLSELSDYTQMESFNTSTCYLIANA